MLVTALFLQILKMSTTASVVILAVILVRLALKRAPKIFSYVLWSVVLFRLLCPVSFSGPVSLFSVTDMAKNMQEKMFHTADTTGNEEQLQYNGSPRIYYRNEGELTDAYSEAPDQDGQSGADTAGFEMLLFRYGAMIWIFGMAFLLFVSVSRILWLRKQLADAVQVEDNIYETSLDAVPFVFGLAHPQIYLPAALKGRERDYILLHERTHIRRCDHIVKAVAYLSLMLHWFNPLVWLAFYLAEKDMEMSCDEEVMRKSKDDIRADYSESLLEFAIGRRMLSGMPLAFGEGDTKDRIKNVMKYRKPALIGTVAAVLVVGVVVIVLAANPKKVTMVEGEIALTSGNAEIATVPENAEVDYLPVEKITVDTMPNPNMEITRHDYISNTAAVTETTHHYEAGNPDVTAALNTEADAGEAEAQMAAMNAAAAAAAVTYNQAQAENVTRLAQKWADAFCGRDGEALIDMCSQKVKDGLKEQDLLRTEGGIVDVGWSSPWPMAGTYQITVTGNDSAEIRYYAIVSDPHATVWREKLYFDSEYEKVISEELVMYDQIESRDEYSDAYPYGVGDTVMDYAESDLGEALNANVMNNKGNSDFYKKLYEQLCDPEKAALYLLNISSEHVRTVSQKKDDGIVTITIHFGDDARTVWVNMVSPYGTSQNKESIWVPTGSLGSDKTATYTYYGVADHDRDHVYSDGHASDDIYHENGTDGHGRDDAYHEKEHGTAHH